MSRPTSFRLPDDLLEQLDQAADASGMSVTALVATLAKEDINTRRFPGDDLPRRAQGRRAGLVAGPDIWEIIRAVSATKDSGEKRLRSVADTTGLPISQVSSRRGYAAHPAEIDEPIKADKREAERVCQLITRRERLLFS